MGRDPEIIKLLKDTFNRWKDEYQLFLLPILEFFLVILVPIILLISPLLVLTVTLPFLDPLTDSNGNPNSTHDTILFSFQVIIFLFTFFIRGLVSGGAVSTVSQINSGKEYRFFNLLRNGWKRKWTYMLMEALVNLVYLIVILIFLIPVLLLIGVIFVLVRSMDMLILAIFMIITMGIITTMVLIPVIMLLSPIHPLAYAYEEKNRNGVFKAVLWSIRWIRDHLKGSFIMGMVLLLGQIIASNIPFSGSLFSGALIMFMDDMALKIVPDGKVGK
jgi:hypothetical protein